MQYQIFLGYLHIVTWPVHLGMLVVCQRPSQTHAPCCCQAVSVMKITLNWATAVRQSLKSCPFRNTWTDLHRFAVVFFSSWAVLVMSVIGSKAHGVRTGSIFSWWVFPFVVTCYFRLCRLHFPGASMHCCCWYTPQWCSRGGTACCRFKLCCSYQPACWSQHRNFTRWWFTWVSAHFLFVLLSSEAALTVEDRIYM